MTNEELLIFICFTVLINTILQIIAYIIGKEIGYKREVERLHKRREAKE